VTLSLDRGVEVPWTPWQGTRSHDHGAFGAYTVLHGELTETWTDRRGRPKRTIRAAESSAFVRPGSPSHREELRDLEAISVHACSPPRLTGPGLT